jgi:hypothetical protein
MKDLIQLGLPLILFGSSARPATYFVAPRGDDSSSGSRVAPFRTLSRGVKTAGPGDTVIVRDGIYGHENARTRGDDPNASEGSPVVLTRSGNPGAWITIRAEHKWSAVLDCEDLCDAYIDLKAASYIAIRDFVITRGAKEGIHSNDAAHHIALQGNRIEYIANRLTATTIGLDGMYTNPQCHDFVIDGNVFHDIGRTNPSRLDHGLYLRGANFIVTNNIFYNIPHGWSIQAADGLTNALIANNTFSFPNGGGQDGQIMLWNAQAEIMIRNNIFYHPVGYAITRYHSMVSKCVIDHNLIFGASGVIADSSGCALGKNFEGLDPLFVDVRNAPYDFHLRPASPAIASGAFIRGVQTDLDGLWRRTAVPDIGAYAFVPGGSH